MGPFRGGRREPKLCRSLSEPASLFRLALPDSENSLAGVLGTEDPGVDARGPSSESIKLFKSLRVVPELGGVVEADAC